MFFCDAVLRPICVEVDNSLCKYYVKFSMSLLETGSASLQPFIAEKFDFKS
jgi:hypothetical protein